MPEAWQEGFQREAGVRHRFGMPPGIGKEVLSRVYLPGESSKRRIGAVDNRER